MFPLRLQLLVLFLFLLSCSVLKTTVHSFRLHSYNRGLTGSTYLFSKYLQSAKSSSLEFLDKKDHLSLPQPIQKANKFAIGAVKKVLFWCYGDRDIARFAALETIARVPYFSYTSVLHLYETLGWFRKKEYIKMHFAESWNELHHLLIMEELGGNKLSMDRFIAQYIACFYYWLVVALYMVFPAMAYDLNKHVETHAFETYDNYLRSNENQLKSQPPPKSAVDYYENDDPYLVDAFQSENIDVHKQLPPMDTINQSNTLPVNATAVEVIKHRRESLKKIENLFDVFERIREDEAEHAKTMFVLQREMVQSHQEEIHDSDL